MYVPTYQKIGLTIEDSLKLTSKYKISWFIDVDKDPEPDAFVIYKETKYGNKLALMGSDGSKIAKSHLIKYLIKLMNTKGWFVEASHGVADILLSNNITVIDSHENVQKILGKDVTWLKDGEYERSIGDVGKVKKRLFGNPKI